MSKRILIGGALVVAVALALAAPGALAKKPGGGGKPPRDNPPGTVYYTQDGQPQLYAMNADGSGKVALPTGVQGEPSHVLHGDHRWFLRHDQVSGTYPDGAPRYELFAVRDDGTNKVQLTDEPLHVYSIGPRWTQDAVENADGFVSWGAMIWSGSTSGSTLVGFGIFGATIEFDADGDVVGLAEDPVLLVEGGLRPMLDPPYYYSEIRSSDWKPDGSAIVYQADGLFVYDLGDESTTQITTFGGQPAWSPDGLKIAFFGSGINTIDPDGTNLETIVANRDRRKGGEVLHSPRWSPASTHLVYERYSWKPGVDTVDVYRVKADGSSKTDLTSDTDAFCVPVAWR